MTKITIEYGAWWEAVIEVEISGSKKIIDKLDSVLFEGCT